MSNMVSIVVGDNIPLFLFLEGREADLYPVATIRQADGTFVDTIEMVHQNAGRYVSSEPPVAMPDTEFVTVDFTVYTTAQHLTESLKYKPVIDMFAALLSPITDKTDQMIFTVPNFLDINLKRHNDQVEYGSGTPGDPWRGYP
jgi:hypothetical protein